MSDLVEELTLTSTNIPQVADWLNATSYNINYKSNETPRGRSWELTGVVFFTAKGNVNVKINHAIVRLRPGSRAVFLEGANNGKA